MSDSILQEIDELYKGRPFLTISEVAQLLGCPEKVVYNWTRRNDISKRPPKLTVGRTIGFPKRGFVEWLMKEQGNG